MSMQRFVREHGLRRLGQHHVFLDRNNRPVIVRQETRREQFRGDDDFGASFDVYKPSYMGEESYDGDDRAFEPTYMDGDDSYDGDMEYVGEDEFGAKLFRRKGGHGGGGRRARRQAASAPAWHNRPSGRVGDQSGGEMRAHVNQQGAVPDGWCKTVVSGTQTLLAAGAAQVQIRLQHDLLAEDIAFNGSVAGAKVSAIFFADRLVWSTPNGVDVTLFQASNFIRGLLNGQRLRAGLDITVTGTTTAAGDFAVNIFGSKPYAVAMGQ